MTPSEALVFKLCRKSFMSLWSFATPRGKHGNELCDILVVCEPDVIIFSVKEVRSKESGDVGTDWTRWTREAIDQSIKQIYGAERWLNLATHVVAKDGGLGLRLPSPSERRVHRIAVALGSEGRIPMGAGDHGKGYVHVFEERALDVLMHELNTITDFTDYLRAKETWLSTTLVIAEGEESVLAMYLRAGRRFEHSVDGVHLAGDMWASFAQSEPYKAKQRADMDSEAFDEIIETFSEHALAGTLEFGATLSDTEQVVRVMARESRLNRRILGKGFKEFYIKSGQDKRGLARMTRSPSGVVYVFLAAPRDVPRELRAKDLQLRCLVARTLHEDGRTVVGVAMERYDGVSGLSLDGCLVDLPALSEEQRKKAAALQADYGYFVSPEKVHWREDEYPGAQD